MASLSQEQIWEAIGARPKEACDVTLKHPISLRQSDRIVLDWDALRNGAPSVPVYTNCKEIGAAFRYLNFPEDADEGRHLP